MAPNAVIQFCATSATQSLVLSNRLNDGTPRRRNRTLNAAPNCAAALGSCSVGSGTGTALQRGTTGARGILVCHRSNHNRHLLAVKRNKARALGQAKSDATRKNTFKKRNLEILRNDNPSPRKSTETRTIRDKIQPQFPFRVVLLTSEFASRKWFRQMFLKTIPLSFKLP